MFASERGHEPGVADRLRIEELPLDGRRAIYCFGE
jgi:hypothetical protein